MKHSNIRCLPPLTVPRLLMPRRRTSGGERGVSAYDTFITFITVTGEIA